MKKFGLAAILLTIIFCTPVFAQVPPAELTKIKQLKAYVIALTKTKLDSSVLNYTDTGYQEHLNYCKKAAKGDKFQKTSGGSILCRKDGMDYWFNPANSPNTYFITLDGKACSVVIKNGYALLFYSYERELLKAFFNIAPSVRAVIDKRGKLTSYQYKNGYYFEESNGNIKPIALNPDFAEKYYNPFIE